MTFDDRAVHGYLVTWNNTQPIADSLLFEWNLTIAPRRDLPRRRRREIQQRLDGTACAAPGTELDHLTEEDQNHDDAGCPK